MYKARILMSLLFSKTPNYHGRSFLKSRIEGLEYSILFSFVENSKKAIRYGTTKEEQRLLIHHWGRMATIVDDLQDENKVLISYSQLKDLWKNQNELPNSPLIKDLAESINFIRDRVSRTDNSNNFLICLSNIMESQKIDANLEDKLAEESLRKSEKKGAAFLLALVYLLDPIGLDQRIVKAVSLGGAWGQCIDDFADFEKDRELGIPTVFSLSNNPRLIFYNLSNKYKMQIRETSGRKDFIIPFAEDLMFLAKLAHLPLLKDIYRILNK